MKLKHVEFFEKNGGCIMESIFKNHTLDEDRVHLFGNSTTIFI